MKNLIILCITVVTCHSCISLDLIHVSRYFTNKFENSNTGIDTLIDINGYYKVRKIYASSIEKDTNIVNILFYNNGLFIYDIKDDSERLINDNPNIQLYFNEIKENHNTKQTTIFYGSSWVAWGTYKISGDTIKTQVITKGEWLTEGVCGIERWYKIIDKSTITEIKWDYFFYSNNSEKIYHGKIVKDFTNLPSHYVALSVIPSPEQAWILKQKWFWKDENEWRKYMEKHKTR